MRFTTNVHTMCIKDSENSAKYCFSNLPDAKNCCNLLNQLDDERKSLNNDLNKQFLLGSKGYNPFHDFEMRHQDILKGDGFLMFLRKCGARDVHLTNLSVENDIQRYYKMFDPLPYATARIGKRITLKFEVPLLIDDDRIIAILANEIN